ncbi:hypothetical protein LCGC14_1203680 [marine sediment metagenome]|uniref:Uncharacterized protein n=1 Tax=marine sediment metagenome TaxID=412755 RepID=A0A0F9LG59_9ZZZZ
MADARTRFTSRQVTALKKSGALGFVASMFAMSEDDLVAQQKRGQGTMSGPTTSLQGRRDIVGRLQDLTNKEFEAAVETGFVKALGQAWGIKETRVIKLRADDYPDQRDGFEEAPAAPERKFHTHDGRSSHPTSTKHRAA